MRDLLNQQIAEGDYIWYSTHVRRGNMQLARIRQIQIVNVLLGDMWNGLGNPRIPCRNVTTRLKFQGSHITLDYRLTMEQDPLDGYCNRILLATPEQVAAYQTVYPGARL
jgi:hypothetical protein